MSVAAETVRVNISLPRNFVDKLRTVLTHRSMSRFFFEAAEEKLAREKWNAAFETFLKLPPTLTEIHDPVQWVEALRAQDEERLTHLGV